jgi:hypothetical protein
VASVEPLPDLPMRGDDGPHGDVGEADRHREGVRLGGEGGWLEHLLEEVKPPIQL